MDDGSDDDARLEARIMDLKKKMEDMSAAHEREVRRLKLGLEKKEKEVRWLTRVISSFVDVPRMTKRELYKWAGKDMGARVRALEVHARNKVWGQQKVLQENWTDWDPGNKKAPCNVFMKRVVLQEGEIQSVFWKTIGIVICANLWKYERNYSTKKARTIHEGEFFVVGASVSQLQPT